MFPIPVTSDLRQKRFESPHGSAEDVGVTSLYLDLQLVHGCK